jgi:hypothetical protein
MDKRTLNPSLSEYKEEQEYHQIDARNDEEGSYRAHERSERKGSCKTEVDENQHQYQGQDGGHRHDGEHPDGLLNYFQLHILTLQTGVVLDALHQLGDGLYVLVVGKHVEVLMKQTLARLVQRIVLLALASPG